ncbi:hypothetical protein DXB03_09335 [Lachnospiraceae bacterium OF11-28]|jgi:hypothetical protein|nr:hypothetical protein DXB03_09335 [Lachnospiraceae bacterium OF11-28]DAN05284.1 MAG TPA: helix-turn-helix domain protein [Caudoviricetes sp.]
MKHDLYSLENILNGSIEHTGLTAGEVHHMIGLSVSAVRRYANEDNIYHRTWRILQEAEWTDGECLEWDFLRAMVRHGLRHTRNFRKLRAYGEGEEMGKNKLDVGYIQQGMVDRRMQDAITPARMAEVRKKVKIGDKIIIVPVKCGGEEQKGKVIGIYRSFVTVKLKNGVCESVSWLEAMKLNKKMGGWLHEED